ncbi:hypothetical protein DAPK24_034970 [Pichia kluyveri]|uniref:Zn(2)-C6 fungal-type domain-containing protein n=1 Tax=Pichia kluyveri TaxID=36015 RepID=A0AAV5R6I9_PICKL|nr:hypothetical protein DAPK24_034970 [Pichia kluyveri]
MSFMRKPHKKAKTGCSSCKKRRIKCDEGKPTCLRCEKRNLQCVYLPVLPRNYYKDKDKEKDKDKRKDINDNESLKSNNTIINETSSIELPSSSLMKSKSVPNMNNFSKNDENLRYSLPMYHYESNDSNQSSNYAYNNGPLQFSSQNSNNHNVTNTNTNITNANSSKNNNMGNSSMYYLQQSNIQSLIDINNSEWRKYNHVSNENSKSINNNNETKSTSEKSFTDSISSLEPVVYKRSSISSIIDKSKHLDNKYEEFCTQIQKKFSHKRHDTVEPENPTKNNFRLPQPSINFKKFDNNNNNNNNFNNKFFQDMKSLNAEKNKLNHSVRLPHLNSYSNDENFNKIFNSMFITPSLDFSYLSNLHINNQFLSYACHFELNMKIQKFCTNNLPFILTKDKFCIQLIMIMLEYSPLYESLYHVFTSLAFISIYHSIIDNKSNERDPFFGFEPEVYLTLSDYHMSRSIQSLNLDVNLEETCRRTCCLYLTSIFQILCSILQPSQKICSRSFLMLYKNMEFIGDTFNSYFKGCSRFIDSLERFLIKKSSTSNDLYFPNYLFDLPNVNYFEDINNHHEKHKKSVELLNDENKRIINIMVERLSIVYRSLRNKINFDYQVDNFNPIFNQPYVIEDDLIITIHRLFYKVPDQFIHLVSIGEPRSLIIIGYSILLLNSKPNHIFSKCHLLNEVEFILNRLDKLKNAKYWKAWLNPVIVALNNTDQSTIS